jgi:hypothetical protein
MRAGRQEGRQVGKNLTHEHGRRVQRLCEVGREGGRIVVEPPEARAGPDIPQQRRVDVVDRGGEMHDGARGELGQQRLLVGAAQAFGVGEKGLMEEGGNSGEVEGTENG